jgi:hypothetical protein
VWWCAKHEKWKMEHNHKDEGPCPLWYIPIGWWANLMCFMKTCEYEGTCLRCNGTKEVIKRYYAKRY